MSMRLAAEVDLFLCDRTLLLYRHRGALVGFPATPAAWNAVASLSSGSECGSRVGAGRTTTRVQALISATLFEAGMLEPESASGRRVVPEVTTVGRAWPGWEPARVTSLPVQAKPSAETPPTVIFVMGSWADLALLDPSCLPSGQAWAVSRLRAGTVQMSSLLGLPEATMCWDCLRGRLLGHEDVVRSLWPLLRNGTCTRLTVASPVTEETELVLSSTLRAAAAEPGAVVLDRGIGGGPVTLHPVQPYASCRHARAVRRARQSGTGPSRHRQLPSSLAQAEDMLQPLEGLVTGLIQVPTVISNDNLPVSVATARYADASGEGTILEVGPDGTITPRPELSRNAFGGGLSHTEAAVRAGLEGLERYCSVQQLHDRILPRDQAVPGREHLCLGRGSVVTAEEDPRCCREQAWVACVTLDGSAVVAVPASFCYHRQLRPAISGCTGMALGNTRADAVVTGYLEYLEREGVNAWWRRALPACRVPLDHVDDELTYVMMAFHRKRGRQLFALRIPPPIRGVEVVVAASSLTELGFPVLGMGAGFTVTAAAAKAVREAGQALPFERAEGQKWSSVPPAAVSWLAAYANAPLIPADSWTKALEPAHMLARAVELARAAGRILLVLDYQRPEVPFTCVRVFVPSNGTDAPPSLFGPGWGELPW